MPKLVGDGLNQRTFYMVAIENNINIVRMGIHALRKLFKVLHHNRHGDHCYIGNYDEVVLEEKEVEIGGET